MTKWGSLVLFVMVVSGLGMFIGINMPPGDWYLSLNKPFFTPPNWLFAPVWTVLYIIIGVVGWRTWKDTYRRRGFKLWLFQMGLNFLWSPLFFGAHQIGIALVVLLATTGLVFALIVDRWNKDRISALLFVPYFVWVSFATLLNGSIVWLNR